jgi:long-chain acyl-CoA synthetase
VDQRIWHASYPAGLPRDLVYGEHDTLATLFEGAFARNAGRTAVTCNGESLSFAELEQASARLAAFLQAAGLQPGDRVALLLPNHLLYPVALAAIARAGFVGVTMNPLYTVREVEYQLTDSGASALVVADPFTELVGGVIERTEVRHVVTVPMQDVRRSLLAPAGDQPVRIHDSGVHLVPLHVAVASVQGVNFTAAQVRPSDLAFLQYTGGTTGVSKGACLTHRNVLVSVLQMQSWLRLNLEIQNFELVTPLPLYHIFPLGMALMALASGGHNRLVMNPRDITTLCTELRRAPFDVLIGVNTMFNGMVNMPELSSVDFSRCRMVIGAGASIQAAVARKWEAAGGPPITEAYGLTETSPSATFNAPGCNGTIGVPVPSTDVLIVDDAGDPVPQGTPGELLIKGPQVFRGYWNNPEETAKTLTADGWLRTGDVVTVDADGFTTIVDRAKELIITGGFNVSPSEVESVLRAHPSVRDAAVFGNPSPGGGETVAAAVEPVPGSEFDEATLRDYCRQHLAAYKVPKRIVEVAEMPKSMLGKILRKKVKEQVLSQL